MKKLNAMTIIGLTINTGISIFYAGSSNDGAGVIMGILAIPLAISAVGILMVLANKLVWGYRLIMIGSAVFAPIGLIAIFGVIKLKKEKEKMNFKIRKAEIEKQHQSK